MKIAIGCDPNAQSAKEDLIKYLNDKNYGEITDFGSEDPIYANTAITVAKAVASGEYDRGILICGTGIGMSIAANKVKGIRCALCSETVSAGLTRAHNDSNVVAMGARVIGIEVAKAIVETFLSTPFDGGRHARRIDKITEYEKNH